MHYESYVIDERDYIDYKIKRIARSEVAKALRKGELKKSTCCQICERQEFLEAHHVDYGKPLQVMWLCKSCHTAAHGDRHPLNPKNNKQTKSNHVWTRGDSVHVMITIPLKTFIAIKKSAAKSSNAFSTLIRNAVIERFPVDDGQLEFNFEVKNDITRTSKIERIQDLETNHSQLHQSKLARVSNVWSQGDWYVERMDGFPQFLSGYGANARGVHRH